MKRRTRNKQELAIDAIRCQGLGDVEKVGHGIEQAKCASNHGGAFLAKRVSEPQTRRDVIFAVWDVAGDGEARVALVRLRQIRQIPASTVVKGQGIV